MEPNNRHTSERKRNKPPLLNNQIPHNGWSKEKELYVAAHYQAEKDMENDPEFTAHNANDDLDEGETARLGEEKTDLI